MKLKPIRIGLYDSYGGSMPSGWTRWLFEQYEFPFEVVFPGTLDAGDLKSKFDVIVFTDGAIRRGGAGGRGGGGGGFGGTVDPETLPAEYQGMVGRITDDKTMPQLKKFVESGGSIVTIGSSTSIAEVFGIPVTNHLVEKVGRQGSRATGRSSTSGSLPHATRQHQPRWPMGCPSRWMFTTTAGLRMGPTAAMKKTKTGGWFRGAEVLDSGWAGGKQYLDGGAAVAEASEGEGKVVLLGPEVNFRDQPHGTYKLLFNGLYFGSAKAAALK